MAHRRLPQAILVIVAGAGLLKPRRAIMPSPFPVMP
jgi:hypothetical protein